MKRFLPTVALLAVAASPLLGCGDCVVEKKSSDSPRLFGGNTHKEEVTVEHADGSMSTAKSETKTR